MLSLLQNSPSLEKYMVSGVEMVTVTVVLMVPGQSRYPTKQSILIFSLCQTQPGLSDLHSTLCWPSSGPTVRYPSLPPSLPPFQPRNRPFISSSTCEKSLMALWHTTTHELVELRCGNVTQSSNKRTNSGTNWQTLKERGRGGGESRVSERGE